MNTLIGENIETEFLQFKDNIIVFPNKKDYILTYNLFKRKFEQDILPEIKTKIREIENEGYFNDHGVNHIKMVIERVSKLLSRANITTNCLDKNGLYISPYELFILLMSIYLHDAGHLIATRANHAIAAKAFLNKINPNGELTAAEKRYIGDISKAHGGKDDPIGKLSIIDDISHQVIHPQFLAALLRLGDELAEDNTRSSNLLLDIDSLDQNSIIYHLYSNSLDSININSSEIKLSFYIGEKYLKEKYPMKVGSIIVPTYLIDEIYARTFKTFLESLYCSRFFPEILRINTVKVDISILTDSTDDQIKKISYELKESGYPSIKNDDIFTMCKETLIENEKKLDGEYIKNLITKS